MRAQKANSYQSSPAPAPAGLVASPRIARINSGRGKRRLTKALSPDSISLVIGNARFKFLARDTELAAPESDEGGPPCVDNRPMLVAGKPELREYKTVYVVSDAEIGLFSDEVVVNCAP
jgi:hypothetical protein